MENSKKKVIFIQLGSPKSPNVADVRAYLKRFLSNKKIIEDQTFVWKMILYLLILPFRAKKSASRYQQIWDGNKFLQVKMSDSFYQKVKKNLKERDIQSILVYSFDDFVETEIANFIQKDESVKVFLVPLYPQFCQASSGLLCDFVFEIIKNINSVFNLEFISFFNEHKKYIDCCINHIDSYLKEIKEYSLDLLIISFHNMPIERLRRTGDPYFLHCQQTFALIKNGLKEIERDRVELAFQSGFGRSKKIWPEIDKLIEEKIAGEYKNIAIFCPGFLMDNLETQVEINIELRAIMERKQASLYYIPCLNDASDWCKSFSDMIISLLGRD